VARTIRDEMEYHPSMPISVSSTDAKNDFEQLLAAAMDGDEVIIERDGRPVARLVAATSADVLTPEERHAARRRWLGSLKSPIPDELLEPTPKWLLDEFEKPLFEDAQ
jgi:prevent-host-death family protein